MTPSAAVAPSGLVKNHVSDQLPAEILNGSLKPGERVVEAKLATTFGVAQASIREALSILAQRDLSPRRPVAAPA